MANPTNPKILSVGAVEIRGVAKKRYVSAVVCQRNIARSGSKILPIEMPSEETTEPLARNGPHVSRRAKAKHQKRDRSTIARIPIGKPPIDAAKTC